MFCTWWKLFTLNNFLNYFLFILFNKNFYIQGVPKVPRDKKLNISSGLWSNELIFVLVIEDTLKFFFHTKTVNRYYFEPSLLTSISKYTHFRFFQKMLSRESPEMVKSFWAQMMIRSFRGHIFPVAKGPLDYNDLQKIHGLVQFWLRYGIFSELCPWWLQFF
jgi:hypothetical protein